MKTILFPTDFSDAATRAFVYSLHLANKLDARIITLHVFQKPDIRGLLHVPRDLEELYNTIDLYEFENFKDAIPALDKLQDKTGLTNVDVAHSIREGEVVATILEQAKAENADLIVMGTTGARGLKEIILGSVAGEVLENASCPVVAVPEQAVFDGRIDNIGATISFQDDEKLMLDRLLDLFAPFDPALHGVNVDLAHTEPHNQRMADWRTTYAKYEKVNFEVIDATNLEEALTGFLNDKKIDILAMVTHKRNFLEELFNYSRTKAMSYHSNTPIMSFPAHVL